LSADVKQKISLGRGLVRSDVSAVLFDEPLTVIDPHLKWQLRCKLKQIHRELKLTLIYVTHDQVEALTFAEQVIVMTQGKAVQTGTPDELFERPQHTFVGHFIGSPGMNFLEGQVADQRLRVGESSLNLPADRAQALSQAGRVTLGIRPEFVTLSDAQDRGALPAAVTLVKDIGTHWMISATAAGRTMRARVAPDVKAPQVGDTVWFSVIGPNTCFYSDDRLIA
jgi:glycerol transport system ATP-binding protein